MCINLHWCWSSRDIFKNVTTAFFIQTYWQATGSPRYTVWLRKWQHTVPPLPVKGLWNVIWATVSAIFTGATQTNNRKLFPSIIFGKFSKISLLAMYKSIKQRQDGRVCVQIITFYKYLLIWQKTEKFLLLIIKVYLYCRHFHMTNL